MINRLWIILCSHCIKHNLAIDNWQWQMQAGVTNPLSDTFRIYNPNKNLEEKDGDLKFIYHWVEELRGYSLAEILDGAYLNGSPYPTPILDWAQTRKVNGKIVSNLRKQVKQRLLAEQGIELEQATSQKKRLINIGKLKTSSIKSTNRKYLNLLEHLQ